MDSYKQDLKEIRDIMNRSTRFISLSGLSGVSAGIIALIGTALAYRFVFLGHHYLDSLPVSIEPDDLKNLLLISISTFVLAFAAIIYFTQRRAAVDDVKIWNSATRNLAGQLAVPIITGALVCCILIGHELIALTPGISLIFYGIALIAASHTTLNEIRGLGMIQTFLGLIALQFTSYSLWLWALGFGVLHIVYGIYIQRKYS